MYVHFLLCVCVTMHGTGRQGGKRGLGPRDFLPFGSHPLIWSNVYGIGDCIVADCQAQVCNGTHAVLLHQNVL